MIAEVSDRIYVSGITAEKTGNNDERIRSVFNQMKTAVEAAGSDMRHLAKATYYVSENEISGDFGKIRKDYYDPKLLLMSFLGNSARRWADSPEAAISDVQEMMRQLPPSMPCIFMTTAPAYSAKIVDLRLRAQKNLMSAFEKTGSRCTFVPGATPETVAANQGNKHYFRLNKSGMVKDPYHPNQRAAENFFALEMDGICNAIFDQID